MKSLIYWMLFQILAGLWLFFSPFVMGFRAERAATINDMILGAIVIALGLGVTLYGFYQGESSTRIAGELHTGTHFKSS